MSSKNAILMGLVSVILAIILIIVAAESGWAAAAVASVRGGPIGTPKPLPPTPFGQRPLTTQEAATAKKPPSGDSAVKPQLSNTDAVTPAITAQDVTDYVMAHLASLGKIRVEGPYTVESVEFLSAQQVNQRLNTNLGTTPKTLVCLARVKGTFISHPPPDENNVQHEVTYHTWYLVFDAHTGNLLIQNVRP